MSIRPHLPNCGNEEIQRIVADNGADKPEFLFGSIGKYSYANDIQFYVNFAEFGHVANLHIGKHCSIAHNVKLLFNRNHDYKSLTTSASRLLHGRPWVIQQRGQIIIGNDVWIGNDVNIIAGVRIGDGAVIGTGTVVTKDIPKYAIAVGNPVKILRYRYSPKLVKKLCHIRWWNWSDEQIARNKIDFSGPIDAFIDRFYVEPKNNAKELSREQFGIDEETKVFLFYADSDDPYPLWRKVIIEFVEKFVQDSASLLVVISEGQQRYDEIVTFLAEHLNQDVSGVVGKASPVWPIDVKKIAEESQMFAIADYYLVNRCSYTMQHIEWCDDHRTALLSGVDVPIFTKEFCLGL